MSPAVATICAEAVLHLATVAVCVAAEVSLVATVCVAVAASLAVAVCAVAEEVEVAAVLDR